MRKAINPRGTTSSANKGVHPTKDRLINTACALLELQAPETITVDQVLKTSGISKGSLYHHFEDFSHLLEVALIHGFTASVDVSISVISAVVRESPSREVFFQGLQKVTEATQSPSLRLTRFKRARIIVLSDGNERLGKLIAREQQRLTAALTDLIVESQHKGETAP